MSLNATMPLNPASSAQGVELVSVSEKLQLLNTLKRVHFSGRLVWINPETDTSWTLFFSFGQILYATGGRQSIRRWHRYLNQYSASLAADPRSLHRQLVAVETPILPGCPDHQLLCNWVEAGHLEPGAMVQFVAAIASEVMFDVTQVPARYGLKRTKLAPVPSELLVESDIVAANVQRIWQQWEAAKLPNYVLSRVPIIRQPGPLQAGTSPQMYRMLTTIVDGKRTLWEIVVKTQREVVQIIKPLHPLIAAGWIELADRPSTTVAASPPSSTAVEHKPNAAPIVACVDDSLMVCQSLEKIIRSSGYGFTGIIEPSRAIATLLIRKPSIIFLDLIMPETNGYEICTQLRKTTQFKEVPIIILTGNDGVVDQVRARLVGATDFISKPVDPTIISNIIRKYMPDNQPAQ